jgi:hypothetical protein
MVPDERALVLSSLVRGGAVRADPSRQRMRVPPSSPRPPRRLDGCGCLHGAPVEARRVSFAVLTAAWKLSGSANASFFRAAVRSGLSINLLPWIRKRKDPVKSLPARARLPRCRSPRTSPRAPLSSASARAGRRARARPKGIARACSRPKEASPATSRRCHPQPRGSSGARRRAVRRARRGRPSP